MHLFHSLYKYIPLIALLLLYTACTDNPLVKKAIDEYQKSKSPEKSKETSDKSDKHSVLNDTLKYRLEKIIEYELESYQDSSDIVITFDNCQLKIGHLFHPKRLHAVASCSATNDEKGYTYFFVYKKQKDGWVKEIDDPKECVIKKLALIKDFNGDKTADVVLNWRHCGQYCNGSFYTVHVYDKKNNAFVPIRQLEKYPKIALDLTKRNIYGSDNCKQIYTKFRWNKLALSATEEIELICDNKNNCERRFYTFSKNERKQTGTDKKAEVPAEWNKFIKNSKW